MLELNLPGRRQLLLTTLVLDLNGTLSLDGVVLAGVAERLDDLRSKLAIEIVSADTHHVLEKVASDLNVAWTRLDSDECGAPQKLRHVEAVGPDHIVAIGNGINDVAMLRRAALGIAVVGAEGLAVPALTAADVVVGSITDALDLLLHPLRLYATLRC